MLAMQGDDQAIMMIAATLVLIRGGSHGRLLVQCADGARVVETRRGTMAVIRGYGSPIAENVAQATRTVFETVLNSLMLSFRVVKFITVFV